MLQTDGRTQARTDNMKTVYPPQTKFAGGIKKNSRKSVAIYLYSTIVRLFSSMNSPMFNESSITVERHRTDLTNERPFTRVLSHVFLESSWTIKSTRTQLTDKLFLVFVYHHMSLLTVLIKKSFSTCLSKKKNNGYSNTPRL